MSIIKIPESVWRSAASNHRNRIKTLLGPGLTRREEQINSGNKRRGNRFVDDWTALDPVNPIYNFLIEYYGIKGAKGPRRLSRWAPDPNLLLDISNRNKISDGLDNHDVNKIEGVSEEIYNTAMKESHGLGGIFLENANINDLGGTLHLRGSIPLVLENENNDGNLKNDPTMYGVLYNPAVFYNRHINPKTYTDDEKKQLLKTIAPFQWYSSIMQTTLESEPILHCHGLHEWAMQYHPEGAPPPPSAKYQSALQLRVTREVINETVERKGISCTHVDALRFFAPAAGPLNHHGSSLERTDQLRLEQKACVHAHMDLLKIAVKLQPFIDTELLADVLELSLMARKLDVEASPYDATSYGANIVPVETPDGRKMYRERQRDLMSLAEPIRKRLLEAYSNFMILSFDESFLNAESAYVAPERNAKAEPSGLPWRKNLIEN